MPKVETDELELQNTDLLPANCKLLGNYSEGDSVALVWKHRLSLVHGLTMIGDAENEPAFSDESNFLTQLFRSLQHLESLAPQRLVIDWQLRIVGSTPEALLVKSLRRLSQRRCVSAIIVHKKSNHVTARKLLSFCKMKKSVPLAIAWLRSIQRPNSGDSHNTFPKWAPSVAALVGVVTFLFFIALSGASLFQHPLPAAGHFPAVVVLALGGAVSSGLFGGQATVNGPLPIPFLRNSTPIQISVVRGMAILIVLLILGKILF